jgi:NADPH:quinone reductase-like Zn-dependent oxidoreductase
MTTAALDPTDTAGAAATMLAIVQPRYGADPETTLRLAETPLPTVGPDEVLVRVRAASVDRGTWHVMTGMPYAMRFAGFGVRRPKSPNPGRALAGVVEAVGTEVSAFAPGDEVYGTCDGSFASSVVASPSVLAAKPVNLTFEQAAAVPISGVTALQAIRKADVRPGQRVLVVGASGGVGSFAVQIAKAFGAEVTGVCRGDKAEVVRSLGADHIIDHRHEDFADGTHHYDVIIDTGGNRRLAHLRRALTADGTLVIVGGETGGRWLGGFDRSLRAVLLSPFVRPTLTMLASKENAADLAAVGELIDAGQVVPAVDRTYPLCETPAAIRYLMDGHATGKVVIDL